MNEDPRLLRRDRKRKLARARFAAAAALVDEAEERQEREAELIAEAQRQGFLAVHLLETERHELRGAAA